VQPTIYAPSTPHGKSAIAIVRITGPQVSKVWLEATRSPRSSGSMTTSKWPPSARRAILRDIHDPITQQKLDQGLVIYFPGEKYTSGLKS
jgi:tRNA modification GTPase